MKYLVWALLLIQFYVCGQSSNLLSNGSFEGGNLYWNHLTATGTANFVMQSGDVQDGIQALSVNVTTLGTNTWEVQSIHTGWVGGIGKEYIVNFYAKAANAGTQVQVVLQKNAYFQQRFTLSTSWKRYEWRFTNTEAGLQLKFQYIQTGIVLLDNVSITSLAPPAAIDTFTISPSQKFQVLDGFGGSLAFYTNWLALHPHKEEIYKHIFDSLGLDILRLRNEYDRGTDMQQTNAPELVARANALSKNGVRIFLGSWSPPAALKSNDSLINGTLKKENARFVYNKFGLYWHNSLLAYHSIGIIPKWISIQNEPDFLTSYWESCKFTPTETALYPGYDKAVDSVYAHIRNLPNAPEICGPEPTGIGNSNFQYYTAPLAGKSFLKTYSYHLYNGGTEANPDSYNEALHAVAIASQGKSNFMTEFELNEQSWWKNAWLINNVLTQANASSFFYWDLVWPGSGLIDIDDPWKNKPWRFTKGYNVNPQYYAFKHFSKPLSQGHQRIGAKNSNEGLLSSAFLNSSGDTIVAVLINKSNVSVTSVIDLKGYTINSSAIYQSSAGSYYKNKGAIATDNSLVLPDSSVTTILLSITKEPLGINLEPTLNVQPLLCMPNPFEGSTRVTNVGTFTYTIFDITGKPIEKGSGEHVIIVGEKLRAGYYRIQIISEHTTGVATLIKY